MGKKWGNFQKKEFSLKLKNNVWRGFSDTIENFFISWRGLGGFP